jgi:hypothetical protein
MGNSEIHELSVYSNRLPLAKLSIAGNHGFYFFVPLLQYSITPLALKYSRKQPIEAPI